LFELRTATTVAVRIKDRAEVVRLNAHGWYVEKIAAHFNWHPQTVRDTGQTHLVNKIGKSHLLKIVAINLSLLRRN
jgi:hypothetical protein